MAMIPESEAGEVERDARLAVAYRAGAREKPATDLDDVIRAAARRAVAAGPRRGGDRLRRWRVPLSLAAVVVLSVTVVTMMRDEGVDRWDVDDSRAQRKTLPAVKPEIPAAPVMPPPAPAAATPEPKKAMRPPVDMRLAEPVERAVDAEALTTKESGRVQDVTPDADRAQATSAAAARLAAPTARRPDDAPHAAEQLRSLKRSVPARPLADSAAGVAGTSAAPQSAPASIRSSAKAHDALWQDLEDEPAAKWLARIQELRRAGRGADADRLLEEYQHRFPGATLPDEVR